jgi:hypothetical protein
MAVPVTGVTLPEMVVSNYTDNDDGANDTDSDGCHGRGKDVHNDDKSSYATLVD